MNNFAKILRNFNYKQAIEPKILTNERQVMNIYRSSLRCAALLFVESIISAPAFASPPASEALGFLQSQYQSCHQAFRTTNSRGIVIDTFNLVKIFTFSKTGDGVIEYSTEAALSNGQREKENTRFEFKFKDLTAPTGRIFAENTPTSIKAECSRSECAEITFFDGRKVRSQKASFVIFPICASAGADRMQRAINDAISSSGGKTSKY
ncbi:hypothetical protein [Hydrogenophaga sp.]|uniref:hypothetical protein n=1 Tax=Hydrogenophaga sp. TaxID=1904254 RepID=UPI003F704CF1